MNNYILLSNFFTRDLSIAKISSCFIAQVSLSLKFDKIFSQIFHDIKSFFKLYLQDHSAVDYPANLSKRFLLYYLLIDYIKNMKYYIFSRSGSNNVTLNKVYPCAEWLERESFDFFGIFYNSHPDLRRILTDYGFPSYALRKDFPVQGYFDLVYSIASKKIQFKEIEFQQSFRVFIKENPYK